MNLPRMLRLSAALLALLLAGCRPSGMEDYKQTVRSGLQTLPWPLEIEQLFGDADHFLTHWNFSGDDPLMWQTDVFFGGRFELAMEVRVEVDYWNRKVVKAVSPPKFYLWSWGKIVVEPGGGVTSYRAEDSGWGEFGEAEWRKLVAAKGDWSVIGIALGNTNPVPNFDALVQATRRDRVRVK